MEEYEWQRALGISAEISLIIIWKVRRLKILSLQIIFILGNESHKNNPLRITGKIIQM